MVLPHLPHHTRSFAQRTAGGTARPSRHPGAERWFYVGPGTNQPSDSLRGLTRAIKVVETRNMKWDATLEVEAPSPSCRRFRSREGHRGYRTRQSCEGRRICLRPDDSTLRFGRGIPYQLRVMSPLTQASDEFRAEDVQSNDTSAASSESSDSGSSSRAGSDASTSNSGALSDTSTSDGEALSDSPVTVELRPRRWSGLRYANLERTCQDWAMVKRFGRDVRGRRPGRSTGKRRRGSSVQSDPVKEAAFSRRY